MGFTVFFDVLLVFAKVVEDLRIWATWVADWSFFDATGARPPVFFVVIEENAFVALDATLVTNFSTANFGDICFNASLGEDGLPNLSRFVVARNAVFFVTNKTGNIKLNDVSPIVLRTAANGVFFPKLAGFIL